MEEADYYDKQCAERIRQEYFKVCAIYNKPTPDPGMPEIEIDFLKYYKQIKEYEKNWFLKFLDDREVAEIIHSYIAYQYCADVKYIQKNGYDEFDVFLSGYLQGFDIMDCVKRLEGSPDYLLKMIVLICYNVEEFYVSRTDRKRKDYEQENNEMKFLNALETAVYKFTEAATEEDAYDIMTVAAMLLERREKKAKSDGINEIFKLLYKMNKNQKPKIVQDGPIEKIVSTDDSVNRALVEDDIVTSDSYITVDDPHKANGEKDVEDERPMMGYYKDDRLFRDVRSLEKVARQATNVANEAIRLHRNAVHAYGESVRKFPNGFGFKKDGFDYVVAHAEYHLLTLDDETDDWRKLTILYRAYRRFDYNKMIEIDEDVLQKIVDQTVIDRVKANSENFVK